MNPIKDYFSDTLLPCFGKARLSENAEWLLEQRYFVQRHDSKTNEQRKEQSFLEFARRVARIVTSAETLYLDANAPASLEWLHKLEANITNDILNKRFLFNSPCLFNAGANLTIAPEYSELIYKELSDTSFEDYKRLYEAKSKAQQLFACFVIDTTDSIEGIFNSVRDAAVISKYGGGVGCNFGKLREQGAKVGGGTCGVASGPVSFMDTWNTMCEVVVQGGKRRAALMGILPVDHPDIERFIDCKTEEGKLPYFNISVAATDEFMKAAQDENGTMFLFSPTSDKAVKMHGAGYIFNRLCQSAWERGDPGVFFIDRAQADNLLKFGREWRIESTNPCGEQPLPNYTSCNLGSINLAVFINPETREFDWQGFKEQIFRAVYYMDLVIDATSFPLPEIEERTRKIRPVGLGIMGLADAAIMRGLTYGSDKFIGFAESIAQVLASSALAATVTAQMDKGPFPEHELVQKLLKPIELENCVCTTKSYTDTLKAMEDSPEIPRSLVYAFKSLGNIHAPFTLSEKCEILACVLRGEMRNSRRLSIAPTGSISMLLDASAGIEPNFMWHWTRHITKVDDSGTEEREFWHQLLTSEQRKELSDTGKLSNPVFVTAHDVPPAEHVKVMGTFAKYIDSGISKTVNLPESATVEDVKKIYLECYRLGCKGITIYRNNSRTTQPIKTVEQQPDKPSKEATVKERPGLMVFGKTIKEITPWGSIYVTLNFAGNEPFEVFITVGKSGSELKAMTEALSRAISIGLRSGGRLEDFIKTLKSISGKEGWLFNCDDQQLIRSIPDAVARLLEKLLPEQNKSCSDDGVCLTCGTDTGDNICPECGAPLELVSGCKYCFSCGYSPCK